MTINHLIAFLFKTVILSVLWRVRWLLDFSVSIELKVFFGPDTNSALSVTFGAVRVVIWTVTAQRSMMHLVVIVQSRRFDSSLIGHKDLYNSTFDTPRSPLAKLTLCELLDWSLVVEQTVIWHFLSQLSKTTS